MERSWKGREGKNYSSPTGGGNQGGGAVVSTLGSDREGSSRGASGKTGGRPNPTGMSILSSQT